MAYIPCLYYKHTINYIILFCSYMQRLNIKQYHATEDTVLTFPTDLFCALKFVHLLIEITR